MTLGSRPDDAAAPAAGFEITVCTDEAAQDRSLTAEIAAGLQSVPKELPPKLFYDDEGCRLFGEITRLEEYYLTRREHDILARAAPEIVALCGAGTLVELGSGLSEKTRLLLDALADAEVLEGFVPFDVNESALRATASAAAAAYPGISVHGVVGEFGSDLPSIPKAPRRLVALLGGTIGNFSGPERQKFLAAIAGLSTSGETFLLGADLVKDRHRLLAAYDDRHGVTAAFNRNVLRVINRRLDADFDPRTFAHVATYDDEMQWIEMWLRSEEAQEVYLRRLGLRVAFAPGEAVRTEISAKFRPAQVSEELTDAGFSVLAQWFDAGGDFSLTLARRADGSPP
ncbi:MAG: L-histidine N(alpha)-methyltransferase [bacterium]|nr:L-histidine N(alpha)-methyltransferase [bacterium]MDE0668904.1 L-histidine N(alpha)-methyltransferase [bacterium]